MALDTTSILGLPVAVDVDGSEWSPTVQGGTTKRFQLGLLLEAGGSGSVQDANTVFAGPTSGAAGVPTFRNLVAADFGTVVWDVTQGGTARAAATAYAVICGGTTSTGAQQSVASVGTSGQILTSNGAGALPTWTTSTYPATSAAGTILASLTANTITATSTPVLGIPTSVLGTLGLAGNTSGTVTIKPQAAAGTYNFNLPIDAGTTSYVLTSAGGGSSPMTWTNPTSLGIDLDVGSTAITGGATTRILYDNAGVLGEYTITGSGTVVAMQTSPSFVTPSLGVATATSVKGLALGTAAAPPISFTGDTDTGLYSSGANTVDIAAGGLRAATFTTTQSGFFPLGTNTNNSFVIGQGTISGGAGIALTAQAARGTTASPTAIQSGDELAFIQAFGWDGTTFSQSIPNALVCVATQSFTSGHHGAAWVIQSTSADTTTGQDEIVFQDGVTVVATNSAAPGLGRGTLNAVNGLYDNSVRVAVSTLPVFGGTRTNSDNTAVVTISGNLNFSTNNISMYGLLDQVSTTVSGGSGSVSYGQFLQNLIGISGGATLAAGRSVLARAGLQGASPTGTISELSGITVGSPSNQSTGTPSLTLSAIYGLHVQNQGLSGSGITSPLAYGLYVDAQSGSSTNYAAWFNGGTVHSVGSIEGAAQILSGTLSSALTTLTGASDGFRASAANVTQFAGENTTSSSATQGGFFGGYSNDGAAMASGDRLGGLRAGGSSSASAMRNAALIGAFADQAWSDGSAYGSRWEFQTTTNTTTSATTKLILGNAGVLSFGATAANTVPALKPSSTTLQVRLGDDSDFAPLSASSLTLANALTVPNGGTGIASATAYAVLCGGTTSTAAFQALAALGASGTVLTSNGAGALPSFQAIAGSGTVTSITPGSGLTSTLTATAPGAAITSSGTLYGAELVNAQTGTSYAILDADRAKLITAVNTAAQAYSIAQAGAASAFQSGWFCDLQNNSTAAAGIVTITPTTSTINGASTLKVQPGQWVRIVSDGTNYQVFALANSKQLPATATNDDANAGNIGELITTATTANSNANATVTMTIASPCVVTWTAHGFSTQAVTTSIKFTTTGALPTGVTASTTYYLRAIDANTFNIATTVDNALAGTFINTSGSQSGVQTGDIRVGISTGTSGDLAGMSLTAGDWDVSGAILFAAAASTTVISMTASWGTTSATISRMVGRFLGLLLSAVGVAVGNTEFNVLNFTTSRISLSSTTTIYFVQNAAFGTSTMTSAGWAKARRVR